MRPGSDVPDLTTRVAPNDTVEGDAPLTAIQATLVRAAALRLSELNQTAMPRPDKLTKRLSSEAELQRAAKAAGMGESLPDSSLGF